jgi:hypothetical protein
MTAGSVRMATIRIALSQRVHTSGSTSKIRRNNSAQRRRGVQVHPERERHGLRDRDGWRDVSPVDRLVAGGRPLGLVRAVGPAPEIWKKILFCRLSWISLSSIRRERNIVP